MAPPNPLQQLRDLDRTSPRFYEQLADFLHGNEYQDVFPSLQGEDLAWFVDYLDKILCNISDSDIALSREPLDELRKICGVKGVLPKSCTLSDSLLGSVYEGTFNGAKVRIRRVKTYPGGDAQKAKEIFRQVTVVWRHITHPNIVPLLGVTINPPQLISDRMPGGDLTEYISSHPEADRINLLSGVAEGLNHLHSCNVIHGDLNGSNILVDATGNARITDFGLSVVTQDLKSVQKASDECGDSVRWIAPEILDGRGTYSKETDVFSFAMLTIEAFTGAVPFSDKPPRAAMLAVIGGERPPRPAHPGFTDSFWALTRRCWDREVHRRPNALRISCSLGIPAWKRLIDRPLAADECVSLITNLFSDRNETEVVKYLRGDDAQSFVDVMDKTLDNLEPVLRGKCLATLCRICSHRGLLPRSVQIPLCYDRTDAPLYHGGFAEVWKGEHQGREVAVKVIKMYKTSDIAKITRRFCKEVMTWKALRHQNVLPLLGVTMNNNQFSMVSEWMVNGNINEFVKAHRDANRFELLKDVTRGLMYMHSQVMIHGDLKGANILIDRDGHACIADFGLLIIVSDSTHPTTTSSSSSAGTTRWMSPELIDPDKFGFNNCRPTKESDCYALGMVILEVLTSQAPFPRRGNLFVARKVVDGDRPERPEGPEARWFTDDLWGTLERCWSPKPKLRPTLVAVFECLERGSTTWEPLSPSANGGSQVGSDDESVFTMSYYSPGGTVSQDGHHLPVSSHGHPRNGNKAMGRDLPEPPPKAQRRPGDSPTLPASINVDRGLRDPNYASKLPTDESVDLAELPSPSCYGETHPGLSANSVMLTPYGSRKISGLYNDCSDGSIYSSGTPSPVSNNTGMAPEKAGTTRRRPVGPKKRLGVHMVANINEPDTPPPIPPDYPTVTRTLPKPPSSLSLDNRACTSRGDSQPSGDRPIETGHERGIGNSVLRKLPSPVTPSSPPYSPSSEPSPSMLTPEGQGRYYPWIGSPIATRIPSESTGIPKGKEKTDIKPLPPHRPTQIYVSPPRLPLPQYPPATTLTTASISPPRLPLPPYPLTATLTTASMSQSDRRKSLPRLVINSGTPQHQQCNPLDPAPSPQHNPNEPATGASSSGTTSEANPPPFIPEWKHKVANRVVTNEHRQKPDWTSRATPVNNASVLMSRSTKLWERKVEEVTAKQVDNAPPVLSTPPESPSESKSIFKWVRGELIGRGTYSKVYVGLNATTGEMIAVKQVELPRTEQDRNDSRQVTVVEALRQESRILEELDHPHVVQYLGFEETPRYLSILLEYVPGGSISGILRKHGRFHEDVTRSFTSQILDGLDYLHSRGIIHRDIKADNILVEEFGHCKIADFTISKKMDDINMMGAHTTMQGTVFWMAPEVVGETKGYNAKIDIWSTGCVVFEMWTGERPWNGQEAVEVLLQLYQSKLGPWLPADCVLSPQADGFRKLCFAVDPNERPTAGELRQHPYLVLPPEWEFTGFS